METQTVTVPLTKAARIRESVKVRIATNEDGAHIEAIFKANNVSFPVANWETVSANWLVATVDGDLIGCLMVAFSKPIGLLEFLLMKPQARFKLRAIAMQKLAFAGASSLTQYGCSYLSCVVVASNKPFMDVLKKYNFAAAASAVVMVKRLKE